jgi:hypothetical protein
LAIVNKRDGGSERVKVKAPFGNAYVHIVNLAAPSVSSSDGVTIAGESINGVTGDLDGNYTANIFQADGSGNFDVDVPSPGIAIVRVTKVIQTEPLFKSQGLESVVIAGRRLNGSSSARFIPRRGAGSLTDDEGGAMSIDSPSLAVLLATVIAVVVAMVL